MDSFSPHLETDLELMQKEIDKGNRIFILDCRRDLRICDNNLESVPKRCTNVLQYVAGAIRLIKPATIIPLKGYFVRDDWVLPSSPKTGIRRRPESFCGLKILMSGIRLVLL